MTYPGLPALELQLKPRPAAEHDLHSDCPRVYSKLRCGALYKLVVIFEFAVHQQPFVFWERAQQLAWSKMHFVTMHHCATEVMVRICARDAKFEI